MKAPGGSFQDRIPGYVDRVETTLERWLPAPDEAFGQLYEAMRYSVLGGGKRIRPLLVYATGETLHIDPVQLDGPAAALELVHAYSLVHDDLPAMDDDDLRRGKPTTHRAFGEATAILVGDALLTLAFKILADDEDLSDDPAVRVRMIGELADACGYRGLAGGQIMDLSAEGQSISVEQLQELHKRKTAVLIRAAVMLAGFNAPELAPGALDHLRSFGTEIGLAFQIRDDVLDVEGATEIIGKQQGADQAKNKATYPALFGIEQAKERAEEFYQQALTSLDIFGENASPLRFMADYIVQRKF